MSITWRSRTLAAFLLALPFGINLPSHTASQAPPAPVADDSDSDDSDAKPHAMLTVNITLDPTGKADAQATVYDPNDRNVLTSEIKASLQAALSCTLQDASRLHIRPAPGYYFGSCVLPTSRQGLIRQGRISTAPIQALAQAHAASSSLQLTLPDSEVLESIPASNQDFPLSSKLPASSLRFLRLHQYFVASPEKPLPPQIVFRYGYATSNLQRSAIILSVTLLFPLLLLLWLGRKALSADVADRAVVWFSYMRSLQWILNGFLLVWWVVLDFCHVEPLIRFLASGSIFAPFAAHPALYEAVSWVPPAILWLLAYRLSHPVQQQLRGLRWTKRELTLQALYSVLAALFPLALFLTGIRVMTTDGFRTGLLWWVAAFFLRVVAAQALLKLTGMQPQALSTGDLRDRAFGFAERMGVKLQQVYLIPSGKGQVANAFARTGNTISFTDFLLQRMSQREVDYVMAHELTHLKLKHPAKLGYAYMGGWMLGTFVLTLSIPFLQASVAARYALIFTIMSIFPFFWSRRFEYSADAGAVAATGDPRAAISALFKISQLNMMPVHWSKWREKWLTHPSSLRRAHAIAKKAGIPFEEIPAIARDGAAENQNYSLPASATSGGKVHSSQRTKAATQKLSFILVGLFSFVPSLICLAAIFLHSPFKMLLLAAVIPGTLLAFLLFANFAPRFTRTGVVEALNKKLFAQGIQANAWSGTYVGFSPAAAPRLYDGNSNWDIGQLFLRSDRICYCGEETRFALRQDQITAIKFTNSLPSLLPSKRIFIAWKDEERAAFGVFNIVCGNASSTLHANKLTADLEKRLQAWWKTSPIARPLPPQLAELRSPEVRAVTSADPSQLWKFKRLFKELLFTGIFTAVAATLCGLPFHFLPYLLSLSQNSVYKQLGIHNTFSSPGAGWFAVAAAILVRFITLVPLLRYRNLPKLTAAPPSGRSTAQVSTSQSAQGPQSSNFATGPNSAPKKKEEVPVR